LVCFQFSSIARLTAAASEAASSARSSVSGTSTPTSGVTKSRGPPESAPITGVPQAMHSMNTRPNGSR
jgi:hypothetical protein